MTGEQKVYSGILRKKQHDQSSDEIRSKSSKKIKKTISFKKPSGVSIAKATDKENRQLPKISYISTIETGIWTELVAEKSEKSGLDFYPFAETPPNGGWGWVVVFASFLINVIIIGMHNSFSILLLNLKEEFNSSLSETSWVGSMAFGSILVFAPLSGYLANRYGCRIVALAGTVVATFSLFASSFASSLTVLYFSYGIVYGFGTSLCYVQGTVMVTRYFTTKKALASGIALSGSSLGALVMAPLYYMLQEKTGWRMALRIVSTITLLTILCAATYRPLQKPGMSTIEQRIITSPASKIVRDFSLWKNKAFLVWAFAVALNKFGYLVPWVHMGKLSNDAGIDENYGPKLIQLMGMMSTISRLIIGKIVDLPQVNRQYVAQISSCSMGIVNIVQAYTRNKSGMTAYALMLGSLDGGVEILLPIMTLDLVGSEQLSVAWGFILAVISLSSLGPPIAGRIRDKYDSYFYAFYLAGIPMISAAAILFLIPWAKRQHQEPTTSILSIHPSQLEIEEDYVDQPNKKRRRKTWRNFLLGRKPWRLNQFKKSVKPVESFEMPNEAVEWKPYNRPMYLPGT